jgi:hypothetical protein
MSPFPPWRRQSPRGAIAPARRELIACPADEPRDEEHAGVFSTPRAPQARGGCSASRTPAEGASGAPLNLIHRDNWRHPAGSMGYRRGVGDV